MGIVVSEISSKLTEKELINLSQEGNIDAFESLVKQHQDLVFNAAYRFLGNYDDALDLTQEVFFKCFKNIREFRREAKFSTWLYSITANLAKNRWKYKESRGLTKTNSISLTDSNDDYNSELVLVSKTPNPRKAASDREMLKIFEDKLMELPFEKRQIIILRFIEGLPYEEIALIMGIPIGTVKSKINRAREELRVSLRPYFIDEYE